MHPPAFRNCNSQSYEIRNLSSIYARRSYSKLLVEIGTTEVDIYTKDFSFFLNFSKTAPTIFFKIGVLIKCHELLDVYKF